MPSLIGSSRPFTELSAVWRDQDELVHQELSESLAALEAYQRQLDDWQRALAVEREALKLERGELVVCQQLLSESESAVLALQTELVESDRRRQVAELTIAKQATEIATLKLRESELNTQSVALGGGVSSPDFSGAASGDLPRRPSANPVMDSVVAQFDKLRQQRQAARGLRP